MESMDKEEMEITTLSKKKKSKGQHDQENGHTKNNREEKTKSE